MKWYIWAALALGILYVVVVLRRSYLKEKATTLRQVDRQESRQLRFDDDEEVVI